MKDVVLGNVVKDRISGFSGVVTCRYQWLNGCLRATVSPQELKDGKPIEPHCFDVQQLDLVAEKYSAAHVAPTGTPGGDGRPSPKRNPDPTR